MNKEEIPCRLYLEGDKVTVSQLDEFSIGDWGMTKDEYKILLNHNNEDAIVLQGGFLGYYNIKFKDGYTIDALSSYHMEEIN
jgi:hypothetical protein